MVGWGLEGGRGWCNGASFEGTVPSCDSLNGSAEGFRESLLRIDFLVLTVASRNRCLDHLFPTQIIQS